MTEIHEEVQSTEKAVYQAPVLEQFNDWGLITGGSGGT